MTKSCVKILETTVAALAVVLCVCALQAAEGRGGARSRLPTRKGMLVGTEWLAGRLGDPRLVPLHVVQDVDTYGQGHVPGARKVIWSQLCVTRDGVPNGIPPLEDLVSLVRGLGIDRESLVVLYDEEGGAPAARAYVVLDSMGLADRAAMLDGQLQKWRAEGRPLTAEGPVIEISSVVPRPRPDMLVHRETMRDLVWGKTHLEGMKLSLVDARPPGDSGGKNAGGGLTAGGRVPGAVNIFWRRHLASGEAPVLLRPEELHALYREAGVGWSDLVVVCGGTGGTASHTYFVLKYLGYDVRLCEGSCAEWSRAEDTPAER